MSDASDIAKELTLEWTPKIISVINRPACRAANGAHTAVVLTGEKLCMICKQPVSIGKDEP